MPNQFLVISLENTHWTCIHQDVGGVRLINGSYYFSGIVDNFYSTNASRKCFSGAEYYFRDLNKNTLYWIENNLRYTLVFFIKMSLLLLQNTYLHTCVCYTDMCMQMWSG